MTDGWTVTVTWEGDTPSVTGLRPEGECECAECGKPVTLESEADGITWDPETRTVEDIMWGPAMGVCCDLLYAEDMEGGRIGVYGPPD